jgi:hypothetical protein
VDVEIDSVDRALRVVGDDLGESDVLADRMHINRHCLARLATV